MRVDQLLHGYSDGHRQLGASKELPRGAKHTILALSDMSGRSMVPGFEEYVTGYPVPGTEFYAIAKTWYAPEMERPGCVWTHTLLLSASAAAELDDITRVAALFRRPKDRIEVDAYASTLDVPAPGAPHPLLVPDLLAAQLLEALYTTPDAPVVVPVDDSAALQGLLFAVWNQQWPRLRRAFSFCTGSISGRSLNGRPLDLQMVPDTSTREFAREVPGAVFVSRKAPTRVRGGWLRTATADLNAPGEFRAFLSELGEQFGARAFFQPLAELHECVRDVRMFPPLNLLVDLVGQRFERPSDGGRLKEALLGAEAPLARTLFSVREADLLRAIAVTARPGAFDGISLDIANRSRRLWVENRDEGERLADYLLRRDHNVLGEEMLTALVSIVPPEHVAVFFGRNTSLLVSAVRRDPELAVSQSLWREPAELQRELFHAAVIGHDPTAVPGAQILVSMLEAGSDAAAEQAIENIPQSVDVVLDWFDVRAVDPMNTSAQSASDVLSETWRRCLRSRRADILKWTVASHRHPRSMALVARLLDPHANDVAAAGLEQWLDAVMASASLTDRDRLHLHAFSLALALGKLHPQSSALTVLTFETVHCAAAERQLGYEAWSWFDGCLPTLSSYRNWDKCERLRRGLVDRFEQHQWPVRMFVSCAKTHDTFTALLRTCDDYRPSGTQLLQRISREKVSLEGTLSPEWRSTLRSYLPRW